MLMVDGGGSTHVRRRSNAASAPASTLTSHLPRPAQRSYSTSTSYASANVAEPRMPESTRATAKPKPKPASDTGGDVFDHLRHGVTQIKASARRIAAKLDSDHIGSGNSSHPGRPQGGKPRSHPTSHRIVDPELQRSALARANSLKSHASYPTRPQTIDPEVRRAQLHLSVSKPSKPKPVPGTAGDLRAAIRARQQAIRSLAATRNLPPTYNRGHIKEMAIRDAVRALRIANARLASAQQDMKAVELRNNRSRTDNRGHINEMEALDAQRSANLARANYNASRGLDSSGRPIKIEIPKPEPEKPKPEESPGLFSRGVSWVKDKGGSALDKADSALDSTKDVVSDGASWAWDHKSDIGHTALDVIGIFEPTPFADGINAVWYLAEGDKVNAAISAAGMIPYVGDVAKAGKYGYKVSKVSGASESFIKGGKHRSDVSGSTWNPFTRDLWNPFGNPAPNAPRNAGSRVTRLRSESFRTALRDFVWDRQLNLYGDFYKDFLQESDSN
jgi:hypothetical protein